MTAKKKSWIVVTNKWTYLWLVVAVGAILKIPFYDIQSGVVNAGGIFVSLMIAAVCAYVFIRMNTYNEFYNPDHPKPTDINK